MFISSRNKYNIYIYIYIHIHTCIYIYIYTSIEYTLFKLHCKRYPARDPDRGMFRAALDAPAPGYGFE